jgi:hypothetical protein
MQHTKELFVRMVRQIRVQGSVVVPTVVLYKDRKCLVGFDAIESCDRAADLREDFKVQIGNDDPLKLAQRKSCDGLDSGRSTLGIAKDFIDAVVGQALMALQRQGFDCPARILIAEPLSLANEQVAHDE